MRAIWCNNCYYISSDSKEIYYILGDDGDALYCIKCAKDSNE